MFKCDHRTLILVFNEFHEVKVGDMPEDGKFCLLELKDGRHTAGEWYQGKSDGKTVSGKFSRGFCDGIDVEEVAKWHLLKCYDLTRCLENEEVHRINNGKYEENAYSLEISGFKFLQEEFPKKKQYCLLILNNGGLAAGRWDPSSDGKSGSFVYASALAQHNMKEVWAWTALSADKVFEEEEEKERERKHEEELNRNPSADPEKFKYGTDINVYYEKALEKLRKEYPWATLAQMKKKTPYVIAALHGQYVFGRLSGNFRGEEVVREWTDGTGADEFIDFLCEYTRDVVKDSDPEVKFRYGMEIGGYLEKAYEKVKKDYHWLDKSMLGECWCYTIGQVDGEWEYLRKANDGDEYSVYDCGSADNFIKNVEREYQEAALRANPVVEEYSVPGQGGDMHGWSLEKYIVSRLQSGDYKVYVQAGDRSAGGSREFFITPYCFEAGSYEDFLDRYLEIVPGEAFGMRKEDLLPNETFKKFFGY